MEEIHSNTNSYPESGDSSPLSREIEFDNPPPWEDHQQSTASTYKVKLMCSYGGKIKPRPHDNQLSYIGGETKILAVDQNIRFASLASKLSSLCNSPNLCFKYQLPGEDLDALISVTNDDDLDHMMHEYDRLFRASPKPPRLRLFLFPAMPMATPTSQSLDSSEGKLEREHFVEALNSATIQPIPAKLLDPIADSTVPQPRIPVPAVEDQADPIRKHFQDMQNLRIAEEQAMYRRKSDENLAAAFSGDYYVHKMPETASPAATQGNAVPIPAGYWPESQIPGGVYQPTTVGSEQQVYMIQTPAGVYHAPMTMISGRTGGQGFYTMQQPVYSSVLPPQSAAPALAAAHLQQQQIPTSAGYPEGGFGMVRPTTTGGGGGLVATETGYAQVAYDSAVGRQVYYTAQGGVMSQLPPLPNQVQYQAMATAAYNADMRPAGNVIHDVGKVLPAKVSQDAI